MPPRVTRRSRAAAAADHTERSSNDTLLPLQTATENNVTIPSPVVDGANDLSARNKRTYSSLEASNRHATPATPRTTCKTQPTAKRARPISRETRATGSTKENRSCTSGRDRKRQRGEDAIDEVAIGRRRTFPPNRTDTHNPQSASSTLFDENIQFAIGNVESDVEEEDDWHDEPTTAQCQPARYAYERASWQADSPSPRPGSQNTHGSGDTLEDGDDLSPDTGRGVAHTTVAHTTTVMPTWPAGTDMFFSTGRNRISLMNQKSMVRFVLQDAIENVHAYLVFRNAFPDGCAALTATRAALDNAALVRSPGAADIYNRLRSDEEYLLNMSVIPRARIPIIRNGIKERCGAMVADEYMVLEPSKIVDLVAKEREYYNYIYPVVRVGVSVDDRLLKRSQPYRNKRIINVIHSTYFTGGVSSFARRFDHLFPRHRDGQGVMKTEVPYAMVALVATAVYSAVFDWRNGKKEPMDFTTSGYVDVYNGNVNTLKNMLAQYPGKYHTMMSDIYAIVSSTGCSTSAIPIAEIPIAELDG